MYKKIPRVTATVGILNCDRNEIFPFFTKEGIELFQIKIISTEI